jgi:Zn-dependent protease
MSDLQGFLLQASIWVIPLLLAIPTHEAAHAWVARHYGDDTASKLGRVTFNPIKHVDMFGTILLPGLLILVSAPFIFGYAKPVPVNFSRLRNPKRDMIWVALAGPASNILLACIGAVLLHVAIVVPGIFGAWLQTTLSLLVQLNIVLAVFNMLPVLPLDGGRVLTGLLPLNLARAFARTERYGMVVLLGLIIILPLIASQIGVVFSPLAWVILPITDAIRTVIFTVFGLI